MEDQMSTHECPECGEEAVNQPTTDLVPWEAHGLEHPQWSHRDGSSLCPVVGPSGGYEPAQPRERAREGGRENPYQPFTPEHRVWEIAQSTPDLPDEDLARHAGWVPRDGALLRDDLIAQYRREAEVAASREVGSPTVEADGTWTNPGTRYGLFILGDGQIIDGGPDERQVM